MLNVREPILHPVEIIALRPTQITVGMRARAAVADDMTQENWCSTPDVTCIGDTANCP